MRWDPKACVVFVAVLVAGCGEPADAPDAPLPLDLPVVGTVGDEPAASKRVTVQVTREGEIRVPDRDEPLSFTELESWLAKATDKPDARAPDGSSLLAAFLQLDAATPWVVAQWVMQACAHPHVRMWEIALAAQTAEGERGAVHLTLPRDGKMPPPEAVQPTHCKIKVFMRAGDHAASGMGTLDATLRALPVADGGELVCDIVAPPPRGGYAPYSAMVRILDVCLGAGCEHIMLEGAPTLLGTPPWTDAGAMAAYIGDLRAKPGSLSIRVGADRTILAPDASAAALPEGRGRVSGRYGTSEVELGMWEEDLEEVEEEFEEEGGR